MRVNPNFLQTNIFHNNSANWFIHAQGFHHTGMQLVKALKEYKSGSKFISTTEIFKHQYNYKIAVYLLSHSIELLLKSIVCIHNEIDKTHPLKEPIKYNHKIMDMVNDLVRVGAFPLSENDKGVFQQVEVYLKWYGRYFFPQLKRTSETIKEDFTSPDEDGMITFKYQPIYLKTHLELDRIFRELTPGHKEEDLTLFYMAHCLLSC